MVRVVVTILLALMAACAAPLADAGGDRVGPGYRAIGARFANGGDQIVLAIRFVEREGQLVACGAVFAEIGLVAGTDLREQVKANSMVSLDGERVLHGLKQFPEVDSFEALGTAPTRCFRTSIPWRAAFATAQPRFEFTSLGIRVES